VATHQVILGLVALGERCGYELRRELESLDPEWRLEYGQLYRLLGTLKGRGLVKVRTTPGEGGPRRKLYTLTPRGRAELEAWFVEPGADDRHRRDELPLKLKIGRSLGVGVDGLAALVETRRAVLEARRAELMEAWERARRESDAERCLVVEPRLRQVEGALAALGPWRTALAPSEREPAGSPDDAIVCAGSDDPIIDLLARHVARERPGALMTFRPMGSFAGLLVLREGGSHLAGTHLFDAETGEFNVPFVKRLLFEEPLVLINLSHREQGLMVAPGNPKGIESIADVVGSGVRLINRQRGTGTRLLLHTRCRQLGIDPRAVAGFDREAPTHDALASTIARGEADVGMGIKAVAKAWGLGFIPIGHERFDLVFRKSVYDSPRLRPLVDVLHAAEFRDEVLARTGYDVSRMGEVVAEVG
jgi:molybdate-binding protein/DNA-binding PadR family transcriptional regulator